MGGMVTMSIFYLQFIPMHWTKPKQQKNSFKKRGAKTMGDVMVAASIFYIQSMIHHKGTLMKFNLS